MEFITIQWPIELEDLYESSQKNTTGWSGPMFNRWATKDTNYEQNSTHHEKNSTRSTPEKDIQHQKTEPIGATNQSTSSSAGLLINFIAN